jgi:hypothetical protein
MGTNTMILMMKRAALVVIALLTLGGVAAPAFAQESEISPEHLALARKYVELTDRSGIYEVALVQTAVQTMQQIIQQNPEIVQQTDEAITKTLEEFKGKKGDLLDQFARIYALQFSMDELQQIVTFYESPVGLKLSAANATNNQSLQDVMKVFQVNLNQEFFAKVRAELKAKGFDV